MKLIKIIPHPNGGWAATSSEQARWPSYVRRLKARPSAIEAMKAARIYAPASRVCWIAKPSPISITGFCITCNSTGDCPECAGSGKCPECEGTKSSTVFDTAKLALDKSPGSVV